MADYDEAASPDKNVPGKYELGAIADEHGVEVKDWSRVPVPVRELIGVLAAKLATEQDKTKSLTSEAAGLVQQVLQAREELADATRRLSEIESRAGLAYVDHLTGLPNSRAFRRDMERVLSRFVAGGGHRREEDAGKLDVLFFYDLDNFKPVNERAGYFIGDMVLISAAERMADEQRAGDVTYRWAQGDEFARLVRNVEPDQYDSVAENIRTSVLSGREKVLAMIDDDEAYMVLYSRASEELRSLGPTRGREVMRQVVEQLGVTVGVMAVTEGVSVDEITRRAFSFMQKLKHEKKRGSTSS